MWELREGRRADGSRHTAPQPLPGMPVFNAPRRDSGGPIFRLRRAHGTHRRLGPVRGRVGNHSPLHGVRFPFVEPHCR